MTEIPPVDPALPASPEDMPAEGQLLESTPPADGTEALLETSGVEAPPAEIPPIETPAVEAEPVEAPKKPSWISRLGRWWFNPETRFGRFNRAALRVLTFAVVLFAAGAMLVYFWLYRPTQQAWQTSQEKLASTSQELAGVESELADLKVDYEKAAGEVDNLRARYQVMGMLSLVNDARAALLSKDAAAAQTALVEAKKLLGEALPALEKLDKDNAAQIELRLSLSESELTTDPETALKDLEILANGLTLTEKALAVGY
jgi:F0F1-type ATP synthase membrane subunit b/b'